MNLNPRQRCFEAAHRLCDLQAQSQLFVCQPLSHPCVLRASFLLFLWLAWSQLVLHPFGKVEPSEVKCLTRGSFKNADFMIPRYPPITIPNPISVDVFFVVYEIDLKKYPKLLHQSFPVTFGMFFPPEQETPSTTASTCKKYGGSKPIAAVNMPSLELNMFHTHQKLVDIKLTTVLSVQINLPNIWTKPWSLNASIPTIFLDWFCCGSTATKKFNVCCKQNWNVQMTARFYGIQWAGFVYGTNAKGTKNNVNCSVPYSGKMSLFQGTQQKRKNKNSDGCSQLGTFFWCFFVALWMLKSIQCEISDSWVFVASDGIEFFSWWHLTYWENWKGRCLQKFHVFGEIFENLAHSISWEWLPYSRNLTDEKQQLQANSQGKEKVAELYTAMRMVVWKDVFANIYGNNQNIIHRFLQSHSGFQSKWVVVVYGNVRTAILEILAVSAKHLITADWWIQNFEPFEKSWSNWQIIANRRAHTFNHQPLYYRCMYTCGSLIPGR